MGVEKWDAGLFVFVAGVFCVLVPERKQDFLRQVVVFEGEPDGEDEAELLPLLLVLSWDAKSSKIALMKGL